MSENCEVIVIFRSFGQFEAVWRPDSGHEPAEVMFSVTVTFGLTKTESRTKKSLTQLSHLLWVMVLFWTKNANFLQKDADISKIKGA